MKQRQIQSTSPTDERKHIIAPFVLESCGYTITNNVMYDEAVYQELRLGLGVDLPEDYLNFMRTYDGSPPMPDSFWVVPDDWGSSIDTLYVMNRNTDHTSILKVLNWQGLPIKRGLIPIGGDGCFGYILISIRTEDYGSIHFCCTWTEDNVTDIFGSQGFWKIANSFTEFFNSLGEMPIETDEDE